jgi:hypothetical protein
MGTNGDNGHVARVPRKGYQLGMCLAPRIVTPGTSRISPSGRSANERLAVMGDRRRGDVDESPNTGYLGCCDDISCALNVGCLELRPRTGHRDASREMDDGFCPRYRGLDGLLVRNVSAMLGDAEAAGMTLEHRHGVAAVNEATHH